jgi:hypothetical protein
LKRIEPAVGMFEKSRKYIDEADYPLEAKPILDTYLASSKTYSSPLRPQYPATIKTILFHILGYLLPIGLYAAWAGTSILDIFFSKNISKTSHKIWIFVILLIPYLGSAYYNLKYSSLSKNVRYTQIYGGILLFLGLLIYSILGIVIGGLPAQ